MTLNGQSMSKTAKSKPSYVLVLRTCNADMSAYGGFIWPEKGKVKAPDWSPEPVCGSGLHGALWGEGDGSLFNWSPDAKWLVVRVRENLIINLNQKVKFQEGVVVHCGTQESATAYLATRIKSPRAIIGSTLTGGHYSTLTGGDYSTLTGGDYSTLTAGHHSTLTAGHHSTLTGGHHSTLTGGNYSTLIFQWWDKKQERYRRKLVEIGDEGTEPGKAYRVTDGQIEEVTE